MDGHRLTLLILAILSKLNVGTYKSPPDKDGKYLASRYTEVWICR